MHTHTQRLQALRLCAHMSFVSLGIQLLKQATAVTRNELHQQSSKTDDLQTFWFGDLQDLSYFKHVRVIRQDACVGKYDPSGQADFL